MGRYGGPEPKQPRRDIMVKKKVPATRWHDGSTPIEELPAAERQLVGDHLSASDFPAEREAFRQLAAAAGPRAAACGVCKGV